MPALPRPLSVIIGVNGIGMGHTVRQSVVARFLQERGHAIRIITNGYRRVQYFRDLGFTTWDSWMPTLIARDGRIRATDAIRSNLRHLPSGIAQHLALRRAVKEAGVPDVFVSDYEPNSPRLAYHFKRPLVSLDQQSKYRYLDLPPIGPYARTADEQRLRFFAPRAVRSFICSFVPISSPDPSLEIVPPVIPDLIRSHPVSAEPLATAYFSRYFGHGPGPSASELAKIFREHIPHRSLRIYAEDSEMPHLRRHAGGKVEVCAFDRESFIADLARSETVFSNAGFNLISEALTLGKPLHVVPLPTYDQHWCAEAIDRGGLGTSASHISRDTVLGFVERSREIAMVVDGHRRRHLADDPRERVAVFLERLCGAGGWHAGAHSP